MTRFTCSAPGKLFISGEYAVLNGAPSIVTAVDTRATASVLEKANTPSPVLKAVQEHVSNYLTDKGESHTPLPPIQVDSPGFQVGRDKIGLGSSSATTAAACGSYFEWAGLSIEDHRTDLMDLAVRAHRSAQGGRGSGADVVAAVKGGTIVFSRGGYLARISIECIELVAVWSGRAASTSLLIESTKQLEKERPALYAACFDDLTRIAEDLVAAYGQGDARAVIDATSDYGKTMKRLGEHTSSPIVTKEHIAIAEIARQTGGAAKPSGAGGGDVAIGVFEKQEQALQFRSAIKKSGFKVLNLTANAGALCRES